VWADELDVADAATLVRLADDSGLDGTALLAQSKTPSLVAAERALTDEAIARGLFGAPFYLYHGELFWGQDRLDMLDQTITTAGS
jgi:2-hydroxychromene-2-carboxylate isomerase